MHSVVKSQMQEFAYGVTLEWLDDEQIAKVTTVGDMSHPGVDAWACVLIDILDTWPDDKPIAVLQDLTHPNQGLTPYARQRTTDILSHIPEDQPTFSAIVLPPSFINRIIEMFVRTMPFRIPHLENRIFTSVEDALEWLRSSIKANTSHDE